MIKANSKVTINQRRVKQLTLAQSKALEKTAEMLHTNVVQSQVMPRDKGTLQNESTFVDYSQSNSGKVTLVSSTPYARRLYYHPEYDFKTTENPNAQGEWYKDWLPGGAKENFCKDTYKKIIKRVGDV